MKKIYYIASIHNNRTTIYEGTIDYLVSRVFGYDLECGHSWNHRIPLEPKSVKTLVKALNNSASECRRYNDYYEESTKEAFDNAVGNSFGSKISASKMHL